MRRQYVITFLLAIITMTSYAQKSNIVARTQSDITFVVDEELSPINDFYDYLYTGESIAKNMLSEEQIPMDAQRIIATSFSGENNLKLMGKDAFYRSIVEAYANHQSITLSPDMVWLVISQGFARYVNTHAEKLRPKLVNHNGKMDLAIQTKKNLLKEKADWPALIGKFAAQINIYTKGGIAKTITSDFSTTGTVERVASQVTLMESVKSYFEYIVERMVCGIPSVKLKGTAADWRRVLEKTKHLEQYGLGEWVSELQPILKEFIKAAEGTPNQLFWKNIVKRQNTERLEGGGCLPGKPTELDGWVLKLFPDENGKTLDKVSHTKDMPAEYVRVGFKYRVVNPNGKLISETPMELWAGFIGAKVDKQNNMVTPKVGWLVRVAESVDDILKELKKNNNDWGIHLRIQEVPELLSKLEHIKSLHLVFMGKVVIPKWMDKLSIDKFIIEGKMTETEKIAIKKRFPSIKIR